MVEISAPSRLSITFFCNRIMSIELEIVINITRTTPSFHCFNDDAWDLCTPLTWSLKRENPRRETQAAMLNSPASLKPFNSYILHAYDNHNLDLQTHSLQLYQCTHQVCEPLFLFFVSTGSMMLYN